MPPPTSDSWLSSRRFGIVIDAGSSGSRLQIYSWIDARTVRKEGGQLDVLPKVERGTREADKWISKVEPGLASFADNLDGIGPYLAPLLSHANEHVPPSLQEETPLFLLATAGMRLLPETQQKEVLAATCDFLRFHSRFKIGDASSRGPCGANVRVISGEEEGLFGWIAVNFLMDGFHNLAHDEQPSTYGFLDMGGASTQIAFEPQRGDDADSTDGIYEVRLRLIRGDEISHDVFVTTWLGYGTNQARERYVGQTINELELGPEGSSKVLVDDKVPDPCLPKDLERVETPVHFGESTDHTRQPHVFVGTGSFEACLKDSHPLLNKTVTCSRPPCLFNGVHVPRIDFSVSKFIGVSEYWYSSEQAFGLGGAYDFLEYERAASEFCASDWQDIRKQHEEAKKIKHLGGDGQVEDQGKVVAVGKWGTDAELSRLETQCFKAAWIVNVLHEGIGLPRFVDPGGNTTKTAAEGAKVNQKAAQKGLGAPTFQSLDTIDDTAISWTLGRMVLEASREVPPLSASLPQLPEPLEPPEPQSNAAGPPSAVSKSWAEKLKTHATATPSVAGLIIYMLSFGAFLFLVYLLRHRIRSTCRHYRHRNLKRDYSSVEEGKLSNGPARHLPLSAQHSRSSSPDSMMLQSRVRIPLTSSSGGVSQRIKPAAKSSPVHSPRTSPPPLANSNASISSDSTAETQIVPSSHPLYAISMSRNSSQINLVPRQTSSRIAPGSVTNPEPPVR